MIYTQRIDFQAPFAYRSFTIANGQVYRRASSTGCSQARLLYLHHANEPVADGLSVPCIDHDL